MDVMKTKIDFNVLPLASYYLLIGMDWLEKHVVVVNFRKKTFESCKEDIFFIVEMK
jgi:hypothetical protein